MKKDVFNEKFNESYNKKQYKNYLKMKMFICFYVFIKKDR